MDTGYFAFELIELFFCIFNTTYSRETKENNNIRKSVFKNLIISWIFEVLIIVIILPYSIVEHFTDSLSEDSAIFGVTLMIVIMIFIFHWVKTIIFCFSVNKIYKFIGEKNNSKDLIFIFLSFLPLIGDITTIVFYKMVKKELIENGYQFNKEEMKSSKAERKSFVRTKSIDKNNNSILMRIFTGLAFITAIVACVFPIIVVAKDVSIIFSLSTSVIFYSMIIILGFSLIIFISQLFPSFNSNKFLYQLITLSIMILLCIFIVVFGIFYTNPLMDLKTTLLFGMVLTTTILSLIFTSLNYKKPTEKKISDNIVLD